MPEKFEALSESRITKYSEKVELPQHVGDIMSHGYSLIYGAPELETRTLFNDANLTYFAATHQENKAKLSINPEVDADMALETYGKINLGIFFLNQIEMTIQFLKFIGEHTRAEIQNLEPQEVWSQDFIKKYYPNGYVDLPSYKILRSGIKRFSVFYSDSRRHEIQTNPQGEIDA
jgi:hypothetical protein